MIIKYEFVTGELVEIEVSETMEKVIVDFDKEMKNSNRRETRRHNSIYEIEELGQQIHDKGSNIEEAVVKNEERELIHKVINMLQPQQRELLQKVFFEGRSMTDIAQTEGVSVQAIQHRMTKIKTRLRKIIEKSLV